MVSGMADTADATAALVNGTATGHSGDSGAAVAGLAGWQTADALSTVMSQWSQKAANCGTSLGYFGASLRSTATALQSADAANGEQLDLVVPAGNPILNAQAPWLPAEGTGA